MHAWLHYCMPEFSSAFLNSLLHQIVRNLNGEGGLFLDYISTEHQPWRLRLVKTKVHPNTESEDAWEMLLLGQVTSLPQKNGENRSGKKCHLTTHTSENLMRALTRSHKWKDTWAYPQGETHLPSQIKRKGKQNKHKQTGLPERSSG